MPIVTSYTEARAKLASLMDRAVQDREAVVIRRRGAESVVLIAEDELRSLEETAHLLRSPRNARRLFESIEQAEQGLGLQMTVEELRGELRLDERSGSTPGRRGGADRPRPARGETALGEEGAR